MYRYEMELRKHPEPNYGAGNFDENYVAKVFLELNAPLRVNEIITINNPSDEGFVFFKVIKLFRRVFPKKLTFQNNRKYEHEYYDSDQADIILYFGHALQVTNNFTARN